MRDQCPARPLREGRNKENERISGRMMNLRESMRLDGVLVVMILVVLYGTSCCFKCLGKSIQVLFFNRDQAFG